MSEIAIRCGSNVRRLRALRGYSLSELARRSGVAKGVISKLESGDGNPTLETLHALADAMGVPFTDLVSVPSVVAVERRSDAVVIEGVGVSGRLLDRVYGRSTVDVVEATFTSERNRDVPATIAGAVKRMLVIEGRLRIEFPDETVTMEVGDFIRFRADIAYTVVSETPVSRLVGIIDFGEPSTLIDESSAL